MSNNWPKKFYTTIATAMDDIIKGDWDAVKKSFEERSAVIIASAIVKMEELRKKYTQNNKKNEQDVREK